MAGLQTEYQFELPKGYVDERGTLHRSGIMRLATARDELDPLRDIRVKENDAYFTVVVLSRVIVKLGSLPQVTTNVVENLFVEDLAYLQSFYQAINFGGDGVEQAPFEAVARQG
jgi:hypothetical protein